LAWIQRLFSGKGAGPPHISENNTVDEKSRRIATLSDEELEAYKWLFKGYSEAWTTETLGLEKQDAKRLYIGIYRKLGVGSSREIVHYYAPREVKFVKPPGADKKKGGE